MPPSHSGIASGLRPEPFGHPGSIPGGGVRCTENVLLFSRIEPQVSIPEQVHEILLQSLI